MEINQSEESKTDIYSAAASQTEEYILDIIGLTKQYKDFMLDHVNFNIPAGCIMGLIGENGAGKSTTLKSLLGLVHADSGTVRIFGKEYGASDNEIRENLGVVLGELNLPDTFNGKEIDGMLKRIYKQWDTSLYFNYLTQFHIDKNKKIKEYSRGTKVKAALAIALSHGARLLILDEPTSGLDPVVREEVIDILKDFVMDEKNAVLISSHILSDLEKAADYVAFLHQGRIALQGEKDRLLEDYRILKASRKQIEELAAEGAVTIEGFCENSFGAEALVKNFKPKPGRNDLILERPTLEKLMIYIVKGADYERTSL